MRSPAAMRASLRSSTRIRSAPRRRSIATNSSPALPCPITTALLATTLPTCRQPYTTVPSCCASTRCSAGSSSGKRNQVASMQVTKRSAMPCCCVTKREHAGTGRQPVGCGGRGIRSRHARHDLVTGNAGRQRVSIGAAAVHGAQVAAAEGDQLGTQLGLSRRRLRSRRGDQLHLPGSDDAGRAYGCAHRDAPVAALAAGLVANVRYSSPVTGWARAMTRPASPMMAFSAA